LKSLLCYRFSQNARPTGEELSVTRFGVMAALAVSIGVVSPPAPRPAQAKDVRPTVVAFVSDYRAGTVVPIVKGDLPGAAIHVGSHPGDIVMAPNGKTAYVATSTAVTPIQVATGTAGRPIRIDGGPSLRGGLAITPNGRTIYVANYKNGTVTPINTKNDTTREPIRVGAEPYAIAITPNGNRAFVSSYGSGTVTPINTRTDQAGRAIKVGPFPSSIEVSPSGRTVYVLTQRPAVVPIYTATDRVGKPIPTGDEPLTMAMTPDGSWLYVLNQIGRAITPIRLAGEATAYPAIAAGDSPAYLVAAPGSTTYYVLNADGVVFPVNTASRKAGKPIDVGSGTLFAAITPNGQTLFVTDDGYGLDGHSVIPINTKTRKAEHAVQTGRTPIDIVTTAG
jgi:hyaluronoglucosaminidase